MCIKLKLNKKEAVPVRFDLEETNQFAVEVKNSFSKLMDVTTQTPNELWEDIKKVTMSTAKKTIPKRKRKAQAWLTPETMQLVDERQEAKARGNRREWQRLNTMIAKQVLSDKNKFIERKCDEIESTWSNPTSAYKTLKELTGKFSARSDVINDSNGITLTGTEEIKDRWADYCSTLYRNSDDNPNLTGNTPTIKEDDILLPLKSEVRHAIQRLKKRKASGIDEIPGELWQASGEEGVNLMWRLCCMIWEQTEWPEDWCKAVFLPLPKKGNLKECSKHRTISLICHASKIMLSIIHSRNKQKVKAELPDEQAGFCEGRGTRDDIVKNVAAIKSQFICVS
jgi:hypothetical protein